MNTFAGKEESDFPVGEWKFILIRSHTSYCKAYEFLIIRNVNNSFFGAGWEPEIPLLWNKLFPEGMPRDCKQNVGDCEVCEF